MDVCCFLNIHWHFFPVPVFRFGPEWQLEDEFISPQHGILQNQRVCFLVCDLQNPQVLEGVWFHQCRKHRPKAMSQDRRFENHSHRVSLMRPSFRSHVTAFGSGACTRLVKMPFSEAFPSKGPAVPGVRAGQATLVSVRGVSSGLVFYFGLVCVASVEKVL